MSSLFLYREALRPTWYKLSSGRVNKIISWEINPFWVAKLISHEVKITISTECHCDESDHLVKCHPTINKVVMAVNRLQQTGLHQNLIKPVSTFHVQHTISMIQCCISNATVCIQVSTASQFRAETEDSKATISNKECL